MPLNCDVGEDSWESHGLQPVHPKGYQSWVFTGRTDGEAETLNTLATWCKELTHLKRPWCWERLRVGGEGDDRGWDVWRASPTRWTWVWVNSGSWWWTGRPGVLQSMGLQRVGHDWATELNWQTLESGKEENAVNKCYSVMSNSQAPLSMEFFQAEYWCGLPFASPGDHPDLGIEPGSPALQADSLPTGLPGKCKCDRIVVFIR